MTKDAKNLIVGLDIGTSKVVAVVAEVMSERTPRSDRTRAARVAGPEKRRGGQHRGDRRVDPARAGRSRADGRLQDPQCLRRHRRQPYPQLQFERHGRHQGQGSHRHRRRARDRDGQGGQHPDRPAAAAHGAAGIHRRQPGRRARADRHERHPPRSEGAYRHRRGVGGAEHRQVRAPLRPGSVGPDPAADGLGRRGADAGRKGAGRGADRHRRRHHRHRHVHRRRDPPHRRDPDRRRPDHQRHRDGAAHADRGSRRNQDALRRGQAGAGRSGRARWKCRAWATAVRAPCRARRWPP